MLSFDNTQIAFSDKTTRELKKSYWMFWMVRSSWLVKTGSSLLTLANHLRFPLNWALRNTVFEHFCGGETLEECEDSIEKLGKYNIKSVLDYAAEGSETENEFDEATERILATIEMSRKNNNIGFAVFKVTGIARFGLLEKVNAENHLTKAEKQELDRVKARADKICQKAAECGVSVMIDAEESWIQATIDQLVEELMVRYNQENPVVFHTLQLYRIDKLFYLKKLTAEAREKRYIPAFKLVRGAYMEKERARALKKKYASPIHPNKASTDAAFDDAVRFCIENIEKLAVCIGSHNELSNMEATFIMNLNELPNNHPWVHFSQLKGMSDHISYNLAGQNYNVSKYVPYGPLRLVMPYLIRRAEENTSVAGQTGRELFLIKKELNRRKQEITS